MSVEELRKITNKCLDDFGFVDYHHIFLTMGYVNAYNDKWIKVVSN